MISIELVIQEKAWDMIRFLESSYLNITDPAGARGINVKGQSRVWLNDGPLCGDWDLCPSVYYV